jgi:radical SAM protein with 4Fe4S-binding SPASM domain
MKKFKKFYIEITNVCNLSCNFCPKTSRVQEFMTIETFNKILNQIKPYADYLNFHVKGEPLLHPDIDKFLDLCQEKGYKVNITTNGTQIKRVRDKLLMKPALRQINFSLHSLGGNDGIADSDEYFNNIISFVHEAIEKTKIIIALRFWNLDKDNEVNLKRKRNQHLLEKIESELNLPFKIQEKVGHNRGIKISENLYLNQDSEFEWPDLEKDDDENSGFCYGLRNQVAILVDGTVVPCCLDGEGVINLGNIHTTPFNEIIEGERAQNLFNGFSRREVVEELCRKCGFRKKFSI